MILHYVDSRHLDRPEVIGVAVIQHADGSLTLVDCGPECVFKNVVKGLGELGLNPANIRRLLATHIHLDHTGGAWRWQEEFGAQIWVHPLGAPHLADPDRLRGSAARIYGERMAELWGEIRPIPETALSVTEDGQLVVIGGDSFQIFATPGHAQHHNAYWSEQLGVLFTGDVAGVSIRHGPPIPPFPPPDIDLESWQSSIARLRSLDARALCLTHFGLHQPVQSHWSALQDRLSRWMAWSGARLQAGLDTRELIEEFKHLTRSELQEAKCPDDLLCTYEQANPAEMSVNGMVRYWKKHRGVG